MNLGTPYADAVETLALSVPCSGPDAECECTCTGCTLKAKAADVADQFRRQPMTPYQVAYDNHTVLEELLDYAQCAARPEVRCHTTDMRARRDGRCQCTTCAAWRRIDSLLAEMKSLIGVA